MSDIRSYSTTVPGYTERPDAQPRPQTAPKKQADAFDIPSAPIPTDEQLQQRLYTARESMRNGRMLARGAVLNITV